MQKEIWKDVPDYEGVYQVSNLGNVKSFKRNNPKILKACLDTPGYKYVVLSKNNKTKNKRVHTLVAEAFLGHVVCGQKLVVNHINFSRIDNRVDNLEIVTNRENTNKKHIKSVSKYVGVTWSKDNAKWRAQIQIGYNKKHLGYFSNEEDAYNAYQAVLKEL